ACSQWSTALHSHRAATRLRRRLCDPFAGAHTERKTIFGRSQRTRPACIVGTRGVVREVEVEHELMLADAQIRTLDGVVQIASAAVGFAATRGIGERQPQTAAVT